MATTPFDRLSGQAFFDPARHFTIEYRLGPATIAVGDRGLPLPPGMSGSLVWDTVRVGEDVAGHMSEDAEYPGLWVLEDADGQLVGRHHDQEDGAAFLVLRFAVGGQDQQ